MAADVNNLRWKIGWSPWLVTIGVTVAFTIIGAMIDAIGPFVGLGLLGGIAIWYWGVREINNKYQSFVQTFIGESERNARRGIEVDSADLYNLTYNSGNSPPLVRAADTYFNTTIVVTDTSVNLNKGAKYDMEARAGAGGGTNEEIYYDQVTGVRSHQSGAFTELEIQTSDGESTEISSIATDTVDDVVAEVRQRVREIKTPGRGRNADREPNRPSSQSAATREAPPPERDAEPSAPADRSPADETESVRTPRDESADDVTTHPITSVADDVTSRARPTDPIADELCRVLSSPDPNEDRLEEALEDAVDRLEQAGAVAETVERLDDPTADEQIRSAKRTLAARDGAIPGGLEPVFDRVLDETDDAATVEAALSETKAELEQSERERDRIRAAAETVCREADRSDALTFRSTDVAERTTELADALESETIVLERPAADREPETAVPSIAADLDRSVRPQSPQSRELLEALGEPDAADVEPVLRSTVDSLDAYAELRATIADIGTRDVRRRLDAIDDELQRKDGDVYRHLADRVRELEAMIERDDVTDVQLYAIYQESTFYDRTLLPRLSRSLDDGGSGADTGRLIADIGDRVETIEREYIDVRADHNHTIPRHFLSLVEDLRTEAQRAETDSPMRAAGLCSAADEVLDHVEALYERNEYSVMLRRLRG
ncbi:hypothetical protein [Natrinema salaciae]|uniref:Uncharacterized protein n=1 Tax=Natrinema salaciae TaxID=1186196 RepID=A0A1H9NPJ4_9EURY|nr:hypothetical protein [Natrinema salaciae]SER37667.1 hypothetical protein SAMN04489841_3678 [Natrinema salaciae]